MSKNKWELKFLYSEKVKISTYEGIGVKQGRNDFNFYSKK